MGNARVRSPAYAAMLLSGCLPLEPVVVNNIHHSSYLIIRNHHASSGKLSKTDIKVTVFSNVYSCAYLGSFVSPPPRYCCANGNAATAATGWAGTVTITSSSISITADHNLQLP